MSNKDLSFTEMFEMQDKLYEKHDWWLQRTPENAHKKFLYMFEEMGEVVSIIKKQGDDNILNDAEIRAHFIEECTDIMMYFNDMLKAYNFKAEDISKAYVEKFEKNLNREYKKHNK